MAYPYLPLVLRITKTLTVVFLVMAASLTLSFCGKLADAASEPEVRLALNIAHPNLFEAWHDAQAGFRDGLAGAHRPTRGSSAALPTTLQFEMGVDGQSQLLCYREPSAWKRLALQALGALDDSLSVAGLFFIGCGSWLLLRLLQDVTPATPFTQANAQRLRKLALLVLGLNLWHYVAYLLVWALMPAYRVDWLAHPLSHYARLNTDYLVPGLPVGFILAIIAAVYQRGVELSHEAELVI